MNHFFEFAFLEPQGAAQDHTPQIQFSRNARAPNEEWVWIDRAQLSHSTQSAATQGQLSYHLRANGGASFFRARLEPLTAFGAGDQPILQGGQWLREAVRHLNICLIGKILAIIEELILHV